MACPTTAGAGRELRGAAAALSLAQRQQLRMTRGRRPLEMLLVANCAIVAATALGAALVAPRLSGQARPAGILVIVVACLALTGLANVVLLRRASARLNELSKAMESAHKGELQQRVPVDSPDPGLRRLSLSFNEMCARLEDRVAPLLGEAPELDRRGAPPHRARAARRDQPDARGHAGEPRSCRESPCLRAISTEHVSGWATPRRSSAIASRRSSCSSTT